MVVGDSSAESVAHWLRMIGMLLLPANAWRLPFSTYERLSSTGTASAWPFTVAGVPAADAATAAALPGQQFAVLADDATPIRSGAGRWGLHDRTELLVGPWAQLADTVVLAGLLPDVAHQIDELSVECGDSAVDRPLWALGAAVLLLEDLPMDDLARDASELALAHWPPGLDLGLGTTEKLLRRMADYSGADRVSDMVRERSAAGGSASLAVESARLGRLREALDNPESFARLEHTLPATAPLLEPAAAAELDDMLGEALGWVALAGDDAPRALLRITALMDGSGPAADRDRAEELARTLLLPAVLERDADPVSAGWPPMPRWLWDALAPNLVPVLDIGRELPGQELSEATHRWLGPLSVPRGELTVEALGAIGRVEWERAAFRVFCERPRPVDLTPLERAAAFLSAVHSSAVTEGRSETEWARLAAEDAYAREPLDLAQALVLMEVLPTHVPFHRVLLDVLSRTPITRKSADAVARLREREALSAAVDAALVRFEVEVGEPTALVTDRRDIVPLTTEAVRHGPTATAYVAVAEAMLRIDTAALPFRDLASFLWESEMPWDEGFHMLADRHRDQTERTLLAAHLICRGARAASFPREDQAGAWLTATDSRGTARYETAAAELLAGSQDAAELTGLVEQVIAAVPRKPRPGAATTPYGAPEEHPDNRWRTEATSAARRVIKRLSGGHVRALGRKH